MQIHTLENIVILFKFLYIIFASFIQKIINK